MSGKTSVIAAIRTHRWDDDARRIAAQLLPVFGDDLVVAFHDRPESVQPGLPVVDINDVWLRENGLRVVSDWGWRCGDYFAYAVRAAYPQADQVWLIEPDVWFASDPAVFFEKASIISDDLLGSRISHLPADHRFSRGMGDLVAFRAIFALTRFSGRALDHLFNARKDYAKARIAPRLYANDEVFCYSSILANPAFSASSLADALPEWFPEGSMRTDPDLLIDSLQSLAPQGVYHPVRSRELFKRAVASRLAAPPGYLGALAPSLGRLSPEDLQEIAAIVAIKVTAYLTEVAGHTVAGRQSPTDRDAS